MEGKKDQDAIEVKTAEAYDWVMAMSESGTVGEIDRELLRAVLINSGANFEISGAERKLLKKNTNEGRAGAMRAVWGTKYDEYKVWAKGFVEEYEKRTGRELPALEKSRSKTSGMMQFFGELTAFAAGELPFEDLKKSLELRFHNGKMWEEGRKGERKTTTTPTVSKPFKPSSIPPDFPLAAWQEITK